MSISTIATITGIEEKTTANGKSLLKFRDGSGTDYAAFDRPLINKIKEYEGQTVQLDYEETQKNGYTNRYVRNVTILPEGSGPGGELTSSNPQLSDASGANQGPGSSLEGDWLAQVARAAQKGDWRAADALARQEHIERSVALNKAVDFFQYLNEEDRKIKNLEVIFDHILGVLRGS